MRLVTSLIHLLVYPGLYASLIHLLVYPGVYASLASQDRVYASLASQDPHILDIIDRFDVNIPGFDRFVKNVPIRRPRAGSEAGSSTRFTAGQVLQPHNFSPFLPVLTKS